MISMEHRQEPPKDRALDTPEEANRDKHINFVEKEESTWTSGREDKDTDSLVLTGGEKDLHTPEEHKVNDSNHDDSEPRHEGLDDNPASAN
jgi:hypothetical protein